MYVENVKEVLEEVFGEREAGEDGERVRKVWKERWM